MENRTPFELLEAFVVNGDDDAFNILVIRDKIFSFVGRLRDQKDFRIADKFEQIPAEYFERRKDKTNGGNDDRKDPFGKAYNTLKAKIDANEIERDDCGKQKALIKAILYKFTTTYPPKLLSQDRKERNEEEGGSHIENNGGEKPVVGQQKKIMAFFDEMLRLLKSLNNPELSASVQIRYYTYINELDSDALTQIRKVQSSLPTSSREVDPSLTDDEMVRGIEIFLFRDGQGEAEIRCGNIDKNGCVRWELVALLCEGCDDKKTVNNVTIRVKRFEKKLVAIKNILEKDGKE